MNSVQSRKMGAIDWTERVKRGICFRSLFIQKKGQGPKTYFFDVLIGPLDEWPGRINSHGSTPPFWSLAKKNTQRNEPTGWRIEEGIVMYAHRQTGKMSGVNLHKGGYQGGRKKKSGGKYASVNSFGKVAKKNPKFGENNFWIIQLWFLWWLHCSIRKKIPFWQTPKILTKETHPKIWVFMSLKTYTKRYKEIRENILGQKF